MILNLTGQHIVTSGGVYPASGPAPTVRASEVSADTIFDDIGVPREVLAGVADTVRIARPPVGVEDFPDIPTGVSVVIVPPVVAEAMRLLRLTVRYGVAVLTPALQVWQSARFACLSAPDHTAAIQALTGALTWVETLTLHEDLTGLHDAPGLHREADDHSVDAALYRLFDGTGLVRLEIHVEQSDGGPIYDVVEAYHRDSPVAILARDATRWPEIEAVIVDRLRARGALPPERLDGGGR